MEFMIVCPSQLDNNPPQSEINPSNFHVSTLSMDFSKVQNVDKVSVAKKTNFMVYNRKNGLEKAIEKLKEDLTNAKAKEKAIDATCKEIEKMITSASSQGPSAQPKPKDMEA